MKKKRKLKTRKRKVYPFEMQELRISREIRDLLIRDKEIGCFLSVSKAKK